VADVDVDRGAAAFLSGRAPLDRIEQVLDVVEKRPVPVGIEGRKNRRHIARLQEVSEMRVALNRFLWVTQQSLAEAQVDCHAHLELGRELIVRVSKSPIARESGKRLMEPQIQQGKVGSPPALRCLVHVLDDGPERGEPIGIPDGKGKLNREPLERVSESVDLSDIVRSQRRDDDTASWDCREEALLLEQPHGLPNRRPAYVQLRCDPLLRDTLARRVHAIDDAPAKLLSQGLDEALWERE
jgi:hypothetical protein